MKPLSPQESHAVSFEALTSSATAPTISGEATPSAKHASRRPSSLRPAFAAEERAHDAKEGRKKHREERPCETSASLLPTLQPPEEVITFGRLAQSEVEEKGNWGAAGGELSIRKEFQLLLSGVNRDCQ